MKTFLSICWLLCLSQLSWAVSDTLSIHNIMEDFSREVNSLELDFQKHLDASYRELNLINSQISQTKKEKIKLSLWIEKLECKERISLAEDQYQLKLTRLRYKKGVELIKMIYEKILGLDHHFSSLQTYQSVTALSNPNSYPEFQKVNDLLRQKLKKDNAIKLPNLLESNPYVSVVYSLVSSFIGSGDTKDRDQDLQEISCIIDFTARMNSELSTIYYETEYLKENNRALKKECIDLFGDYTKVISYDTALDVCRKEDDWDLVFDQLDALIESIDTAMQNSNANQKDINKKIINLEFSIDRLLSFINVYNNFISQGERYYQKFNTIISNYPNEDKCLNELPHEFSKLKQNIDLSINRFNEAYNIAELKGSKLKDLLYGFSD